MKIRQTSILKINDPEFSDVYTYSSKLKDMIAEHMINDLSFAERYGFKSVISVDFDIDCINVEFEEDLKPV